MPSTLRQRQEQRRRAGGAKPAAGGAAQHLDFVVDEVYSPPHTGILRSTGRLVLITASGNTPGMSATNRIKDEFGVVQIASQTEVIDLGVAVQLPPTLEQWEAIMGNLKFEE